MWTPHETVERIANSSLLPASTFEGLDWETVLEARDDSFDDDWIRAVEAVQADWEQAPDNSSHDQAINAVREAAFKRTFQASGGNHDLAASVSDDFEIICKRAVLGLECPFITELQNAYDAQQIPH